MLARAREDGFTLLGHESHGQDSVSISPTTLMPYDALPLVSSCMSDS